MAPWSHRRYRWLRPASSALFLASVLPAGTAAATETDQTLPNTAGGQDWPSLSLTPPAAGDTTSTEAGATPLILAVSINGVDRGLGEFYLIGESLWASPAVLRELGLRIPEGGDELIALESLDGISVVYRSDIQAVEMMVTADRLDAALSRVNFLQSENPVVNTSRGLLLNYDIFANLTDGSGGLDVFSELRYFSGNSVFETTGIVGTSGWGSETGATRLDTSWSTSFPEKRLTLRLGDTVTVPSAWTRAVRMGGVQFGTNNNLQPYLIRAPLPSFIGSATLPSTVDLFINGIRRNSGEVTPGPFEIGIPPGQIDGSGQAHVVLTDIFGRTTTISFALYETPLLLREGLSDWSVELGTLRENYGLRSFDYGDDPFFSGSWRHGLTDRLTIEAHGEATSSMGNGGVGWVLLLGQLGVLSGSVAGSIKDGEKGGQISLGYDWTNSRFRLSAQSTRATGDYADLAALAGSPPLRQRDFIQVGYNSRKLGSFSAGFVNQRYLDKNADRFLTFNWSKSISRQFSLNLSAQQDLRETEKRGIFATLSYSPGQYRYLSASMQANERSESLTLGARQSTPREGGLGWSANAWLSGGDVAGSGEIDYLSDYGETSAGISVRDGRAAGFGAHRGSLVLMGDDIYASRTIYDGFAVVSTDGVADVPVKLHNQVIGATNTDGNLLVTGLNAYQRNVLALDLTNLPGDYVIEDLAADAVPADRAGVAVRFPLRKLHALTLTVVDKDGNHPPAGTAVGYADGEQAGFVIGFDGQLYIENPRAGAEMIVEKPAGRCRITLPAEIASGSVVSDVEVRCVTLSGVSE